MAGIPPQIPAQLLTDPGTPSQEWARSTTTAAFARSDPAPASSNATITTSPGSIEPTPRGVSIQSSNNAQKGAFDPDMVSGDLPGAYPATPEHHSTDDQFSAKEAAQAAAQQASTFVQAAANTAAQYLPQGVVDTVSSYMPTSSATATMASARASEHDGEHKTSFPTTELSGAGVHEHVDGVGSLPGPVNESAVPKLPDERTSDERYMTAAGAAAVFAGGAYALEDRVVSSTAQNTTQSVQNTAQSTAQTVKGAVPGLGKNTAVTASTVPTREHFGAQPGDRSLGVGTLPGNQSEPHVARLPEESVNPQYDSGPMDNTAHVALMPSQERTGNESAVGEMRHVGGVGALVGNSDESGVARLPDERSTLSGTSGGGTVLGSRDEQGKQGVQGVISGGQPQSMSGSTPAPGEKEDDHGAKNMDAGGHKGKPNEGSGYDTDYHPAEIHPRTDESSSPSAHASSEKKLGATQADASRPSEEQQPPHSGDGSNAPTQEKERKKKASFMEKMKGEAKVLIGKIEKKQDKVEEGERLKSGEAKSQSA